MKFTLNKGVHPEGDIIPMERRGKISDNRNQAEKNADFEMSLKSPRVKGKKLKVD